MTLRLYHLAGLHLLFFLIFWSAPTPVCSQDGRREPPLKLEALISEALANSPEIVAAKRKWEAYREKVPQAGALPDPIAGFGIVNIPTTISLRQEDMTMKEFSISQRFPFYGKRGLLGEIAGKEAEAVFSEIQEKVNRVVRDVKSTYYDLSHVYRTTEVTERNKRIMETFATIAATKYAVGEGIQQDVLKAHVEVSRMVDDLIALGQKKRALKARLAALLDRPPESRIGEPEELIFKKIPVNIEELQQMAVNANPVLGSTKKMIEAKEKAHLLARKEYYPDFKFLFAYGQRDSTPDGMQRRDMLTGMMEINIPIFYGEKQDRKVAETKADILNWQAQYRALKNETFSMITGAAAMAEQRERQFELYGSGILPQTRFQVDSALAAYKVNKADLLTLLDSQLTLFRYEIRYHQALTEYEKSIADLEALVGKELVERRAN